MNNKPHLIAMKSLCLALAGAGSLTFATPQVAASEARFTWNREAVVEVPGVWEFESYVTWSDTAKGNQWDFRHEIEVGITEKFQLALYPVTWRYRDYDDYGARYRSTDIEALYQMTHPVTDKLGSALYFETGLGDEKFFLEGKLILQKTWDKISLVYNGILEPEWEGGSLSNLDERKLEYGNTLGISYEVTPSFLIGLEMVHEGEAEDYSDPEDALYLDPNFSFRKDAFFLTISPIIQLTDNDEFADAKAQMIIGVHF